MTNTKAIDIAKELNVNPTDVWNVYLSRKVKIENVVKQRIAKRINDSR